jgi:hypothetical protein
VPLRLLRAHPHCHQASRRVALGLRGQQWPRIRPTVS